MQLYLLVLITFLIVKTSAKSVLAKLLHILDSFSRLSEREGSILAKTVFIVF